MVRTGIQHRRPWVTVLAIVIVIAGVFGTFGRSVQFDFINYDDPAYVYENEMVSSGLTSQSVKWALTDVGKTNLWHPLTWLSHMVDVEIFGIEKAGGHHAVNVFWHALGSVGLFFLMRRITGSTGIALFLTMLWALHPQRVQSVMWISERKDVLSGAFFLWSWWSWEKWRDCDAENGPAKWFWYCLALGLFVLAGLSKPSVVPLPLILVLREFMRAGQGFDLKQVLRWGRNVSPFIVVSLCVAGLTVYFQRIGGMADVTDVMPWSKRVMLMPVSLWWYVQNFVFPVPGKLWVYPPDGGLADWIMPGVGFLVSAALLAVFGLRNRMVWFGIAVFVLLWLPVSGIVPVSFYYVADRYSYLIHLGLLFVLAGVLRGLIRAVEKPAEKWMLLASGVMVVLLAVIVSWGRVGYWQNSESLFTHERSINPRSLLAPIHLGVVKEKQGLHEQALSLFLEAASIDGESGLAANSAGRLLEKLDRKPEAEKMYRAATEKKILHSEACFSHLARLLVERGSFQEAEGVLLGGMSRFPGRESLLLDLAALALSHQLNPGKALEWYDQALELAPYHVEAMQGKAAALIELGKVDEGEALLRELLKRYPDRKAVEAFLRSQPE